MENPKELIEALLWVIGVLVSALAFFITYYFTRTSKILDELSKGLQQLNLNFTGLNCRDKHLVIDRRLDKHGELLDTHSTDLVRVKDKCGL